MNKVTTEHEKDLLNQVDELAKVRRAPAWRLRGAPVTLMRRLCDAPVTLVRRLCDACVTLVRRLCDACVTIVRRLCDAYVTLVRCSCDSCATRVTRRDPPLSLGTTKELC